MAIPNQRLLVIRIVSSAAQHFKLSGFGQPRCPSEYTAEELAEVRSTAKSAAVQLTWCSRLEHASSRLRPSRWSARATEYASEDSCCQTCESHSTKAAAGRRPLATRGGRSRCMRDRTAGIRASSPLVADPLQDLDPADTALRPPIATRDTIRRDQAASGVHGRWVWVVRLAWTKRLTFQGERLRPAAQPVKVYWQMSWPKSAPPPDWASDHDVPTTTPTKDVARKDLVRTPGCCVALGLRCVVRSARRIAQCEHDPGHR
jgi:hypothetical protein